MKSAKTFFLVIILIILLVIKFFPEKQTETEDVFSTENHSIISSDLSDIKTHQTYYLDKTSDGKYDLSLLYVVLYDDISSSLVSDFEEDFQKRLDLFDEFIEKESLNRMNSESSLLFLNVKDIGSNTLTYDRPIFDWIKTFYDRFENEKYNVLVFVPIYETPWCHDGLSQGFNYNGKIFFCMETFFNPRNPVENQGAIGLMIHKLLHGVGFNHQDQLYKQYQFLDWQIGLPETNILLHGNFRDFDHLFFDEHTLKVLDIIKRTEFEKNCLDNERFVCKSTNTFFCEDSWGPFCQDIDKDGVVDRDDDYVFSSPKKGNDSDSDGIVDSLDLCTWNKMEFSGNGIISHPLKIKASQSQVRISFTGEKVLVNKILITPFEMVGGFIKFNEEKSIEKKNSVIIVNIVESPFWRIQVFYYYNNNTYFRPFYISFPGFDADFFFEKEWYYFTRFGCDIPVIVDFSDKETYDSDLDGLPDSNTFAWAENINEEFDWDDDGFSDLIDTLPTINGNCSNELVKGVKDSDGDGFCDPGEFDFSSNRFIDYYEILMKAEYNEFSDFCPYIPGDNQGCP